MEQIPKIVAAAKKNLHLRRGFIRRPPFGKTRVRSASTSMIFSTLPATRPAQRDGGAAQSVVACLKEYQDFLEKRMCCRGPRASGGWARRNSPRKLDLELDAGLTADQVLAQAETEFARVERDMYVIAGSSGAITSPASHCRRTMPKAAARRSPSARQGRPGTRRRKT